MIPREKTRHSSPYLLPTLLLLLLFITVVCIYMFPVDMAIWLTEENGVVESYSAGFYFIFILLCVFFGKRSSFAVFLSPAVIALLLGLRELDWHSRFTTMGIFKLRYYFTPEIPAVEKTISLVIVLFILVFLFIYVRKHANLFMRDIRVRQPYAICIAMAIILAVLSKFLDSNSDLFITLLEGTVSHTEEMVRVVEECLELFIPLAMITALLQYWQLRVVPGKVQKKKSKSSSK